MLRCMSLNTSYFSNHSLSTSPLHLFRHGDGRFSLLSQTHLTTAGESLARAVVQHPDLLLETFVEAVVEPAPGSNRKAASSLITDGPYQLNRLRLSDGDCIHFPNHHLKALYAALPQPPPNNPQLLPTPPMAETRDSPHVDEDAETESGEDDLNPKEVAETPITSRRTDPKESGDMGPPNSVTKTARPQDEDSDAEVMTSTPKSRITYSKASRRANSTKSSDAATPESPQPTAERSTPNDDDAGIKSTSSSGKLPAVSKRGTKRKGPPRPRGADETYGISAEDEDRPPPTKQVRMPKAARDESSDEDEIVVAPRSVTKKAQVPQRSSRRVGKTPVDNPSPAVLDMTKKPSKLLLSGCDLEGKVSAWIKKKVTVVEKIPTPRNDYVCVTRANGLPSTAKVLKALVVGKPIISVKWITDSHKEGSLLDLEDYKHSEVQENGDKTNRSTLFSDKTLFFTNAAVQSYKDNWNAIQEVAKEAGATAVESGTAAYGHTLTPKPQILLFGDGDSDEGVSRLIKEHSRVVFDKTMFGQAIVRAQLDLDSDEFKLKGGEIKESRTRGK